MKFRYRAFCLSIASAVELPELIADRSEHSADVTIDVGKVPDRPPADGTQLGPFAWAAAHWLWLQVPKVATYWVADGRHIVVEPAPGIDGDSPRVFLLGSAIAALLLQRGNLVLHGNAIEVNGAALLCLGASGAGKSTLAAGFGRRGFNILADDVVAIDPCGRVLPGLPRIKLWRDVADRLSIDTASLVRVRPDLEKFNLPLDQLSSGGPLSVCAVYLLGRDHIDSVTIEPLSGMSRFEGLRDNLYRPLLASGMQLDVSQLGRLGHLADTARVARLTRPIDTFSLDSLVDSVLQDVVG